MNWNRARLPSLHHCKEGGCVIKKISGSNQSVRSRGGFPLVSIGKPPRLRDQRRLRDICLIARPPLLAVMQGGESRTLTIPSPSYTAPTIRRADPYRQS